VVFTVFISLFAVPIPADLARSSFGVSLDNLVTAERISTTDEFPLSDTLNQCTSPRSKTDMISQEKATVVLQQHQSLRSDEEKAQELKTFNDTLICDEQIMPSDGNADASVPHINLSSESKCESSIRTELVADNKLLDKAYNDSDSYVANIDCSSYHADMLVLPNILDKLWRDDSKKCYSTRTKRSFKDLLLDHGSHHDVCFKSSSSLTECSSLKTDQAHTNVVEVAMCNDESKTQSLYEFLTISRLEYANRFPKSASLLWSLSESNCSLDVEKPVHSVSKSIEQPALDCTSSHAAGRFLNHAVGSIESTNKNSSMSRNELLSLRDIKVELSPNVVARIEELQLKRSELSVRPPVRKPQKPQSKAKESSQSVVSVAVVSEPLHDQSHRSSNIVELAPTSGSKQIRTIEDSVVSTVHPSISFLSAPIVEETPIAHFAVSSVLETTTMSTAVLPTSMAITAVGSNSDISSFNVPTSKESSMLPVTIPNQECLLSAISSDYQECIPNSSGEVFDQMNVSKKTLPHVEHEEFDKHILSTYVAAGLKDKFERLSMQFGSELPSSNLWEDCQKSSCHGKVSEPTGESRPQEKRLSYQSSSCSDSKMDLSASHKYSTTSHGKAKAEQYHFKSSDGVGIDRHQSYCNEAKRDKTARLNSRQPRNKSRGHKQYDQNYENYFERHQYGNCFNPYDARCAWSTYDCYEPRSAYTPYTSYLLGARDAYSQMVRYYDTVRKYADDCDADQRFARLWQQQADYIREMSRVYTDVSQKESKL